ncbi:hypothetical protein BFW01_g7012 [Lasiodiplodia theobromae]|uniref:Integral membrane protein n=1 Tax=Lasiodiplodia theobromae TaxID=45133 RepID=UPI0015C35390|nr:Integral membrane protein [Lasiodiplodia theobromae]KAF4545567.1 Integral membrane protein [Lasiodiplodia theobromae]KAF9636117.1 hypothetical protein BFW01_g7012 [Lasiodiplodia theobromae]
MMELEGRAPEFFKVLVVMIVLATVATALRVYVRLKIVKAFGVDDYFMVAALLAFIMFTTCALGGIRYGTGQHMANLTPDNTMRALRYWWLCYAAYTSTMMFAKISIGFFLLRVTVEQVYIWIIYAAMGITIVTGIVFFFVTVLQCSPVSYFWSRAVGGDGKCLDMEIIIGLTYFYSAVSALCDFTFGLLPIVMLWNLNMSRSTKIAIAPILSMACIASAGVLVRTAYVKDFRSPDFLWATIDIAIWSTIEEGLAITAGSLACLRPLFRICSAKLSSYGIGSGGDGDGQSDNNRLHDNNNNRVWPGATQRSRGRKHNEPWSLLEETQNRTVADLEDGRDNHHSELELVGKKATVDVESVDERAGSDSVSSHRILV